MAGLLRWLMAAQTGLLPTPTTPVQITKGLSLWLDEKQGSRQQVIQLGKSERWALRMTMFVLEPNRSAFAASQKNHYRACKLRY